MNKLKKITKICFTTHKLLQTFFCPGISAEFYQIFNVGGLMLISATGEGGEEGTCVDKYLHSEGFSNLVLEFYNCNKTTTE